MAIVTPVLAYLQLAIGAHVRHYSPAGSTGMFRTFVLFHIVVGIALALQILATAGLFWRKTPRVKPLVLTATLEAVLIGVQLALGRSHLGSEIRLAGFHVEHRRGGELHRAGQRLAAIANYYRPRRQRLADSGDLHDLGHAELAND